MPSVTIHDAQMRAAVQLDLSGRCDNRRDGNEPQASDLLLALWHKIDAADGPWPRRVEISAAERAELEATLEVIEDLYCDPCDEVQYVFAPRQRMTFAP